jgi:hypothetical protein
LEIGELVLHVGRHIAPSIHDGNDVAVPRLRDGKFLDHILGGDGVGRKDHHKGITLRDGANDSGTPGLTPYDILSIHPHLKALLPEAVSELVDKFLIQARIADEDFSQSPTSTRMFSS